MAKERIQKFLSAAGAASRREAEQMILDGRVQVNGKLVVDLPFFVDEEVDQVRVDGRAIRRRRRTVHFLLNKPRGVVCTQSDPQGRPRAVDLVGPLAGRLHTVGRLDVESTGIILLTNDGALTQYLTHPRYGVTKTYVAEIDSRLTNEELRRLREGGYQDGRRTSGAAVKVLKSGPAWSVIEVTLTEGPNREVRRVLAKLGHKVKKLKRIAIGPITDRGVKIGNFRALSSQEVQQLRGAGRAKAK
jgi:23S rRNA pseudouridine2605 synthase